jgi:hypothetical protein
MTSTGARADPGIAQLKQQRERSGHTDVHALRGALIFPEMQLPPRVFSGQLKVQEDRAPTGWRPPSSGFTMPSEELDF